MKVLKCGSGDSKVGVNPKSYNECTFEIVDKWDESKHAKTCDTIFFLRDGSGAYLWDCDKWVFLSFSGGGSGGGKPTLISNKDNYILIDGSGTYAVGLTLNEKKVIDLINKNSIFTESELPGGGKKLDKNRLHLTTDQHWFVGEGHLSDVIRLQALTKNSKPAITWYDMNDLALAAVIAHDGANDPKRANHKHISIETKMGSTDELWTRMEFPYGFDKCEIQTHDSNLSIMRGKFRIGHEKGYVRQMTFNSLNAKEDFKDENGDIDYTRFFDGTDRWKLMCTEDAETGNNVGSDFVFASCRDDGSYYRTVLGMKRSNGYIGLGMKVPTRKLDIDSERIRLRSNYTPASSTAPGFKGDICYDENYMYRCYEDNKWGRVPMEKTW